LKESAAGFLFGGPMLPIALFWILVVATLVVFAVDIVQKRHKGIR
jgi:uncharacterized membrane protein